MIIQNKVANALVGASGLGASLVVDNITIPDVADSTGVVSVIVQLLIGVVTLFKLLRKKKE